MENRHLLAAAPLAAAGTLNTAEAQPDLGEVLQIGPATPAGNNATFGDPTTSASQSPTTANANQLPGQSATPIAQVPTPSIDPRALSDVSLFPTSDVFPPSNATNSFPPSNATNDALPLSDTAPFRGNAADLTALPLFQTTLPPADSVRDLAIDSLPANDVAGAIPTADVFRSGFFGTDFGGELRGGLNLPPTPFDGPGNPVPDSTDGNAARSSETSAHDLVFSQLGKGEPELEDVLLGNHDTRADPQVPTSIVAAPVRSAFDSDQSALSAGRVVIDSNNPIDRAEDANIALAYLEIALAEL